MPMTIIVSYILGIHTAGKPRCTSENTIIDQNVHQKNAKQQADIV